MKGRRGRKGKRIGRGKGKSQERRRRGNFFDLFILLLLLWGVGFIVRVFWGIFFVIITFLPKKYLFFLRVY